VQGYSLDADLWGRFGGLRNAYQRIGYSGVQSSLLITETRQRQAHIKKALLQEIVTAFPDDVRIAQENWRQRLRLRLRNNTLVTVYLCRSHCLNDGSLRWCLDTSRKEFCKLSLVARMNPENTGFIDFHLLPGIRHATRLTLTSIDPRLSRGVRFSEASQFLAGTLQLSREASEC
jgi:hypothetical protein